MNARPCAIVCAIGLAAGLGGCGDKNKVQDKPTIPSARAQPYIRDVPVPQKFERDERQSTYTSTAGRRAVRDFYVGKIGCLEVRNFYFQNMPLNDWELLDEKLTAGVYALNYKKGEQRCEVRIERMPGKGVFESEKTQICVTIPDAKVNAPE